jgi:hypothetical protein
LVIDVGLPDAVSALWALVRLNTRYETRLVPKVALLTAAQVRASGVAADSDAALSVMLRGSVLSAR